MKTIKFLITILALSGVEAGINAADLKPAGHAVHKRVSTSTQFGEKVISHIADGGGWRTSITLVNLRTTATTATISCFDDSANSLPLPWAGIGTYSALSANLPADAEIIVKTSGTSAETVTGWCYVDSPSDISGFAIFLSIPNGQEVAVPFEQEFTSSLILPFDNTNGYAYGIALVDSNYFSYVGELSDTVTAIVKDTNGVVLASSSFSIVPKSHMSFILSDRFPVVAGRSGTVTFTIATSSGIGTIAGLGLRASPRGALTSVELFEPMTY
jgi:hypothetical protein